jgi:hypothetical protein
MSRRSLAGAAALACGAILLCWILLGQRKPTLAADGKAVRRLTEGCGAAGASKQRGSRVKGFRQLRRCPGKSRGLEHRNRFGTVSLLVNPPGWHGIISAEDEQCRCATTSDRL